MFPIYGKINFMFQTTNQSNLSVAKPSPCGEVLARRCSEWSPTQLGLVGGWATPLKIWVRQWGWDDIPYMKWKIKHVPNHQPVEYVGDTFELYPKLARCSPPEKNHLHLSQLTTDATVSVSGLVKLCKTGSLHDLCSISQPAAQQGSAFSAFLALGWIFSQIALARNLTYHYYQELSIIRDKLRLRSHL